MENRIITCSQKIPLLNKSRLKFAEVVFCTSMQQLRYIFFLLTVYFIENSMIFFKGKFTFFETSLKNNKISIFFQLWTLRKLFLLQPCMPSPLSRVCSKTTCYGRRLRKMRVLLSEMIGKM